MVTLLTFDFLMNLNHCILPFVSESDIEAMDGIVTTQFVEVVSNCAQLGNLVKENVAVDTKVVTCMFLGKSMLSNCLQLLLFKNGEEFMLLDLQVQRTPW